MYLLPFEIFFPVNSVFSLLPLFFLFFLLWFDFLLFYGCVLLGFCESIVCFWLVVTLFFKYVNPFVYLLALDWKSYRLKYILKKKNLHFLNSPQHFMILMSSFTSSCLSFCCSLWSSSLSHKKNLFFSFLICIVAYLSDSLFDCNFLFDIASCFSI